MRPKYWWLSVVLAVGAVILDRFTKSWFVQQPDYTLSLANSRVVLHYYLNTAMAFSLPLFPVVYFSLVILVLIVLIRQMIQAVAQCHGTEFVISLFILIGAFSNLFDRWRYGGVVDFIHTSFGSVFNVADLYIVGAMAAWAILLYAKQKISTAH